MSATRTPPTPIRRSGESGLLRNCRLDCAALCAPRQGRAVSIDGCLFAAPGDDAAERAGAGYLFAVIDGRSERERGDRAVREVESSLLEILDDDRAATLRPDLLDHRLQDANYRLHEFVHARCATTAVWIWEDDDSATLKAAWAHAGDTRLYHFRRGSWKQVTFDHARGPVLLKAVGDGPGLRLESGTIHLHAGERLVLASDGVWKGAAPGSAIPGEPFPGTAEAVRRLVGQARLNGSRDDTTAIAISVREAGAPPEPEH